MLRAFWAVRQARYYRGMTRPLYHENGTLFQFESVVTEVAGQEVALAATAFYPEGGGQPGDAGTLTWSGGAAQVEETRKDKATGTVWHRVGGEVPAVGTPVQGDLNRARRWRHMQRHSAEHLLAQAFARVNPVFQVAAVSMNSPECHLDLRGDPTESHVLAAEKLLRETLLREELTLITPTVPESELGAYPLRRETKVKDQIRLVIFQDAAGKYFDVSACGGTHVPRAAMCAPVVILKTERQKGGLTRVTFMAGEEAGEYLSGVYRQSKALAQSFSVPVELLPERVHSLRAERDAQTQTLEALRRDLAALRLACAVPQPVPGGELRLLEVPEPELLLPVLTQVVPEQVVAAVHAGGRCGVGSGLESVAAGEVLRAALTVTGGKGGGKPDLAQGTTQNPAAFLEAVRSLLT